MTDVMQKLTSIEAKLDKLLAQGGTRSTPSAGHTGGKSAGTPVVGAAERDLRFYRQGCERTLNDESKARWHDRDRQLMAAIDAELARQGFETPREDVEPF